MSGIDETLLSPRRVLRSTPSDDGLGHSVELACGHTIWMAIPPKYDDRGDSWSHCGLCLNALVDQCREMQARQRLA